MDSLTEQLKEVVRSYGGARMGIVTRETLGGGPPSAGVVIQKPDGSLARVSPEEGETYIQSQDAARRSLYG